MIPAINGVNTNQSVQIGSIIDPFNNITITDGNDYLDNTHLTIKLLDQSGNASDNNGYLTMSDDGYGDTLQETSPGVYLLTDTQWNGPNRFSTFFTHQLPALKFIATADSVTTIQMTELDKYNETATANITMTATGSGSPATISSATAAPVGQPGDITENAAVASDKVDTVDNDSKLTLNDPQDFQGKVDFKSGLIDLNGLANKVDYFTFKNDILGLYSSSSGLVQSLTLTPDSPQSFAVTSAAGNNGISIYTWNDTRHSDTSTILPMHAS